jgi:hypothetical protein
LGAEAVIREPAPAGRPFVRIRRAFAAIRNRRMACPSPDPAVVESGKKIVGFLPDIEYLSTIQRF